MSNLADGLYLMGVGDYGSLSPARTVIRRPINNFKINASCDAELQGAYAATSNYLRLRKPWPPYCSDIYATAASKIDLYTIENSGISSGTITKVAIWMLIATVKNSAGAVGSAETVITTNGSTYYGSQVTSFRSQWYYNGSAYSVNRNQLRPNWRHTDYTLNPQTSAAWTWAEVDALIAGFRLNGNGVAATTLVFEFKVVVDYIDGTTGAAKQITLRPDGDSSVACSRNDNADSVHGYVCGETADGNIYARTNQTSYKYLLSAILPIEDTAAEITNVVIKHTAKKLATTGTGNSLAVLRTHGSEYYGTEQSLTDSWTEYTDTWTTNPNTGLPWTVEEVNALCFGVGLKSSSTSYYRGCSQVYCQITYKVQLPGYALLPASISNLTKNPQNPITPDELSFEVPADVALPDLAEVVLVRDGQHVFHGLVIRKTPRGKVISCDARAQQWLLDYRYIPEFIYQSDLRSLGVYSSSALYDQYYYPPMSEVDLPGMFSSDPPRYCDEIAYPDSTRQHVYCSVGALFWINSAVPPGKWTAHSAIVHKLASAGSNSVLGTSALYATTSYPKPVAAAVDSYKNCGVRRLRMAASLAGMLENEYWRTGTDLYMLFGDGTYLPNAVLAAAHNWCDTHIRRGTLEPAGYHIGIDLSLAGKAAKAIDDFFERAGLEIQFLPGNDGRVYLNSGLEISRGSASSPVKRYIDGQNCTVTQTSKRLPDYQAVLGIPQGDQRFIVPKLAIDLNDIRSPPLHRIYQDQSLAGSMLQTKVSALLAENEVFYDIETEEIDYHLRVGDWVSVRPAGGADIALRVSKVAISASRGRMTVSVGKKPITPGTAWGEYLRATASVTTEGQPFQTKNLTSSVRTFVVKKGAASADGGWRCVYSANITVGSDDIPCGMDIWVAVQLNGSIVPPGRIQMSGGGTVSVDITDFCTTSDSADSTNTLNLIYWVAGANTTLTATNEKVSQYRLKLKLVEEV